MSQPPSPRSRPQSLGRDEALLPKGQCRYLLLHPEVRGQRCACVGFSLHRSTPGSSCNCGHQAVYHLTAPTEEALANKEEIETLRSRISQLEELLEREIESKNTLTVRVSALEEHNDNERFEADLEMKNAYRGIEGLWQHFGVLDRRTRSHDDRIDALMDVSHATKDDVRNLQTRLIEVDDASMLLEDRLDGLDGFTSVRNHREASSPPRVGDEAYGHPHRRRPQPSQRSNAPRAWTVHISLMPTASQPFPFEKDTMAYKRVLSRGLHRVVAVPGSDSQSFVQATSKEFQSLLKGRQWMPLVAKICDAEHLTGLPMLRQLPASLADSQLYDFEFLRRHCATLDRNGNILDLYIAMCDDAFAWPELQASPVFLSGLEACWDFDPFLDGSRLDEDGGEFDDVKSDDKQSAGDLLRAWSPPTTRLKRTASGVSRTSSFGSTDDGSKRNKIQQITVGPQVGRIDRRAEAV